MKALAPKGIRIPEGFVITSAAYRYFLKYNNLEEKIREILKGLNVRDVSDLQKRGEKIRELIRSGDFPEDLEEKIEEFYRESLKGLVLRLLTLR